MKALLMACALSLLLSACSPRFLGFPYMVPEDWKIAEQYCAEHRGVRFLEMTPAHSGTRNKETSHEIKVQCVDGVTVQSTIVH